MNILFLQKYNNYANRIIKRDENYIEEFIETQASEGNETFLLENVNFNPNDGISANLIVGDTTTAQFPGWIPDYCIVYDPSDVIHSDALNKDFTPFKSTWFVIESQRTRGNQYNMSLKRDVIRDNYDTIKEADIYVEKGTVLDNDSFVYNSEGSVLNQIKKDETLLKDPTGIQWLVGYIVQDQNNYNDLSATYSVPPTSGVINWSSIPARIKAFMDMNAGNAGKNTQFLANYDTQVNYEYYFKIVNKIWTMFVPADNYASVHITRNGYSAQGTGVDDSGYEAAMRFSVTTDGKWMKYDINNWDGWEAISSLTNGLYSNRSYIFSQFRTEQNLSNYSDYITLMSYNGKKVYDGTTGKIYVISVKQVNSEPIEVTYNYNTASNVRSRVRQCFYTSSEADSNVQYNSSTSSTGKYFKLSTTKMTVNVTVSEQGANTIHWSVSSRRKHIIKEPYDMFCIPFGKFQTKNFVTDAEASVAACKAIALSGIGSSNAIVYDIQILPYCPLQSTITGASFNETILTEHEDYEYIYGPSPTNTKMSIVFWCTEADFTFDIPLRIDVNDVKVENECDFYRLCSPNYQGVFEFNLAKNGGLSFINVDCSYKPFQPYIHLNPDFKNLYGQDFNDSRGLVCGGDFSLAIATNAWEQYKLQNKNYQAIFDRGIQKLDDTFDREYNYKLDKALRDLVLPVQGALTGLASGGPWGALAGAAGTQANALWNTNWELQHMSQMHQLERDYQTDMFNLQNGSVRALPNSLAKTDPFTFNNKKWPFLEHYSCTDEEKEAFRNKIKFNGMTIGRIGKITEFINPTELRFFKGQLIRDNFIIEDSHMVDAIYSELEKGVYL